MMNYLEKKKKALLNYVSGITPPLPSEYQQVEWIESTGTQYIVTDSYAFDGLKIVFDIIHTVAQSGTEVIFNVTSNTSWWLGFRSNLMRLDGVTIPTNIYERHTYTITYSSPTTIQDDLGNSAYFGTSSFVSNVNLSIFATNTGSVKSKFRAYSFKFYDTTNNDELVRDLVPCYRKADNKTGLYDVVNNTFFANNGTGEFSVGNNVN